MRIFCFDQIDPYSDELALLYERERQRGNGNRATLAVARKMVAWNGQESSLVPIADLLTVLPRHTISEE